MASKTPEQDRRFGIGAVSKLTGLSDHTIRVWERRYGAVVAERTQNGRRVFKPADVEKLGLLKTLTDQGFSIGQIAADSLEELRERTQSLGEITRTPVPERVGVAVLGDFLPAQFAASERDIAPLEILIADNNRDVFLADLSRHDVDVLVVESPVLDASVAAEFRGLLERAGAVRGVLVYGFGRSREVERLTNSRIIPVRSPVNVEEVCAAVLRAYSPATPRRKKAAAATDLDASDWNFSAQVAPRRFTNYQLTALAQASTAIDCECPHHLAQLVGDLTAFEIYSANCANRDDDDAALHRYLHQTTSQARALIEIALERVAKAEGIEY